MKYLLQLGILLLLPGLMHAQNTSGIKSANLKGADVNLMNNHDPEVERQHLDLLPGFQINLFAQEPMIANPIHMTWDPRGRLWVVCSWAYPQLKPGDVANDKIIILEDTTGDGKADKSTVFADGLYVPTGIALANGGCYVGQSPDVFFLKDTDGDDVADVKELALTGFGIEDSHHSISAWRRGPGGWLYFQEGIFLHTQVETQYGMVRNFNGGVYQYNPRTQRLGVFAKVGCGNPWGHVFDKWGQSFFVDNPRVNFLSPATGNSGQKIEVDMLMKTEKQCGGDLVTGTHFPPEMRGQLLTGRFKSRAVIRYEFTENGAGFTANVLKPLVSSRHPNFRPVDTKVGPDGAVYVADWYNGIINHAQHDFRDPRRDHNHGRVWRITHKERPLVAKPKLIGQSIPALLEQLKSPDTWTREQTRVVLSERDPDTVVKATEKWIDTLDTADPEHDHHLVEALWTVQNMGAVSRVVLERVLNAKDGHARSAGARALRYWHAELPNAIELVAKASNDAFPRTRMEGILSAGFIPKVEAYTAALQALNHKRDATIDKALKQTVVALERYWRPAMEAGTLKFADSAHQKYAENFAGIGFDKRLADLLKKQNPPAHEITEACEQLIVMGNNKNVGSVIAALTSPKSALSPAAMTELLHALNQLGQGGTIKVSKRAGSLAKLLQHNSDAVAAAAALNLGTWKIKRTDAHLVKVLADSKRSAEVRIGAARGLAGFGNTSTLNKLKSNAAKGDLAGRYAAAHGLVLADLTSAVPATARLLSLAPESNDPSALVQAFIKRRKGAQSLAAGLAKTNVDPTVAENLAAYHRTTGQLPKALQPFAKTAPDGQSLSRKLQSEKRAALVAEVDAKGNPHRGEIIYRNKALACTACHGIGSVGPAIGPNLAAVGAGASTEYVIEAILEPNQSIAEHYENMMITKKDGGMVSGVVTFKSDTEIALRDSAQGGKEVRVAKAEIAKTHVAPSIMPSGLADQLKTRQEFLDLAKFVASLGQPGPFANDESPYLRKWRVGPAANPHLPPAAPPALPAYSKVGGELPAADFNFGTHAFAQAYVEVRVPGPIIFDANDTTGLTLWVDNDQLKDLTKPINVKRGRRTMTFVIDRAKRGDKGLSVQVLPAPSAGTKLQPEGGI